MHYITVAIDDKSFARMLKGLRVEGTVGLDLESWIGDLNAFKRLSQEPGYVKPKPVTLFNTVTGRLKETAKTYNIYVSAKKNMGRKRSATELMSQAKELTDYLRHTKGIEEILDEV